MAKICCGLTRSNILTTVMTHIVVGDKVKLKIAIGFAIACAVLLLGIFIVLLYKVLWFRSNSNGTSKPPAKTVVQGRAPSVTEQDFRRTRQQRRHQPLMRSDSSASDIDLDNSWLRNNNLTSSESESSTEPSLNLGKLEFNINYDTETECLRVTVVAAHNLPSIHSTSYVELYLLPERVEKHQTKIHYSNCSPVYNEEFQFDIGFSELPERTLQCCVYSYDGFSRHQSIGEVFYSFDEDDQLTEYSGVSLIKDIKRDVFLLKVFFDLKVGTHEGTSLYDYSRLQLVPGPEEFTRSVLRNKSQGLVPKIQTSLNSWDWSQPDQALVPATRFWSKNGHVARWDWSQRIVARTSRVCRPLDNDYFQEDSPTRVGEVLVSLCYLPTTNRLTFVVLKARLSKSTYPDELPSPFVKVSLMLAGRQMKKTKTSVARNTLLPVYNEAFVFDVPIDRLSDVSLLVRVLDTYYGDGGRPQTRTIGKTIVGPDAQTSIGLHHWNCMMTTPRKPIAQWHPLVKT